MIETYAEPLRGWRVWHVREGRLLSWSQSGEWPAERRMEARCRRLLRRVCDAAPATGHTCGIYAVRTREAAEKLLHELPPLPGPVAVGQVSLWGRVVENVGGWRAQYAYPYELFLLRGDDATVRSLRSRYAVDVWSSPGRTSRAGASSPASLTGGLSGSASGGAPNDARRRSSDTSP